jgi:hypothetical protein
MASSMKAGDFRNLLKLNNIVIPTGLKRDDVWRLCLEHNLVEREFVLRKHMTVVKCSLDKGFVLNEPDKTLLFGKIEKYVLIVSQLVRRSSKIFYYHLLRLENEKLPIPDFYKIPFPDTYWKRWLKIGFDENAFPDEQSNISYNLVSEKFVDSNLVNEVSDLEYFDQVLNYAGHTFWTTISNNIWYPLFDKLTRLCRVLLEEWKIKDVYASHVIHQIRNPIANLSTDLDQRILEFVKEVKMRLNDAENIEYIGDKHAMENMTFTQAFDFNMWMQKEFQRLEKRMNMVLPVFKVKRTHVRLDLKTLTLLLKDAFPKNAATEKYVKECIQYREFLKADESKGKSKAPHKKMLPTKPEKKLKKNCTEEQWKAYQLLEHNYKEKVEEVKSADLYKEREQAHKKQADNQVRFVKSFFKPISKGKKWDFDGSIQSDGVSLSQQFSHFVRVENKPPPVAEKVTLVEEYNKKLSCFIRELNTLVVGLDPGRTNLASISYYWVKDDDTIEKRFWSLSRKQYYAESGINKRNKLKALRYQAISEAWTNLGTLKTVLASDILAYVDQYNIIKDDWWSLAMNKIESVNALNLYSGKHRTMDRFFSKVKKDLKVSHPKVNITVAYGSAFNSMNSTGRGEVSAPVSATYKSCKRILNTIVENEDFTTKHEWDTGKECNKVYKTFKEMDGCVCEVFNNCPPNKRSPHLLASSPDFEMAKKYIVDHSKKKKKEPPDPLREKKPIVLHYPEIRGLRFCQESRTYVDRDRKSSLAIARLAVMRMTSGTRPEAFSKRNIVRVVS